MTIPNVLIFREICEWKDFHGIKNFSSSCYFIDPLKIDSLKRSNHLAYTVIEPLIDGALNNVPVLEVAYECGFGSLPVKTWHELDPPMGTVKSTMFTYTRRSKAYK